MLNQPIARRALLFPLFALGGLSGCPGTKDTEIQDTGATESGTEDSSAEDSTAEDTRAEPCEPEEETCDGRDNDCDGVVDGPSVEQNWYTDEDRDGYGDPSTAVYGCFPTEHRLVAVGGDCDDDDPDVYEGHSEDCDGRDDDCDGVVPSDEVDEDGDGEPSDQFRP